MKFVWSGWPGMRRFLEEAKTTRWPPGGMMVGEGKRQRAGEPAAEVEGGGAGVGDFDPVGGIGVLVFEAAAVIGHEFG